MYSIPLSLRTDCMSLLQFSSTYRLDCRPQLLHKICVIPTMTTIDRRVGYGSESSAAGGCFTKRIITLLVSAALGSEMPTKFETWTIYFLISSQPGTHEPTGDFSAGKLDPPNLPVKLRHWRCCSFHFPSTTYIEPS
jgi:hypothetical protein